MSTKTITSKSKATTDVGAILCKNEGNVDLVFTRNQIESENYSPSILFLLNNAQTASAVWSLKNRVSFKFVGYESDSREVWEIPQVQQYLKKVLRFWTEWVFFASLSDDTFLTCILCLTSAKKLQNSQQISLGNDAVELVNAAIDGMCGLFESQGFSDSQRNEIDMAAIKYLSVHLSPRLYQGAHQNAQQDKAVCNGL